MNGTNIALGTAHEIATHACTLAWAFERDMHRLPPGERDFFVGRRNGLLVLLQRCGVLPTRPPERPSVDELLGGLSVVRHSLPEGFEAFTAEQVHEFFFEHGIETTLDEVPGLQLYLAAGRKHEHIPPPAAIKAHEESLPVRADAVNGADVHGSPFEAAIVGQEGGAA